MLNNPLNNLYPHGDCIRATVRFCYTVFGLGGRGILQVGHASDIQSVFLFFFILFSFQFYLMIISSSGAQDLDSIRLSTYRTACKLRFVQKKCNCESNPIYISLRSHETPSRQDDYGVSLCFQCTWSIFGTSLRLSARTA